MGNTSSHSESEVVGWTTTSPHASLGEFRRLENSKRTNLKQWGSTWRDIKSYYLVRAGSEDKIVYGKKNNWKKDGTGTLKECREIKLQDIEAMCFISKDGTKNHKYSFPRHTKWVIDKYQVIEDTRDEYDIISKRVKDALEVLEKMKTDILLIVKETRIHVLRPPETDTDTDLSTKAFDPTCVEGICQSFMSKVKNVMKAVDLEKKADDLEGKAVALDTKVDDLMNEVAKIELEEEADVKTIARKKQDASLKRGEAAQKRAEATQKREEAAQKRGVIASVTRRRLNACVADLGTSPACALDTNTPSNLGLGSLPVLMILLTLLFLLGWVLKRRFNLFKQKKERVRRDTFGFLPNSSRPSLTAAERMV